MGSLIINQGETQKRSPRYDESMLWGAQVIGEPSHGYPKSWGGPGLGSLDKMEAQVMEVHTLD